MNQALWHVSATASELQPVEAPRDTDRVPVTSRYSMISTGSERLVALGTAAPAGSPLDAPYAEGDYGFPIKYGYSLVGHDPDGRVVHCLHPHQSTAFVRSEDLFRLPDSVPAKRGALLSNMETVLNACWDAQLCDGQDVLVSGFGNIGALLANTLRLQHDLYPVVIETDRWRRAKARELGFETLQPGEVTQSFDRILHTSRTRDGLQFAIDHAARDGTVVELSWYGTEPVELWLGEAFHRNRVRLVSSQVATIPPAVADSVTIGSRKALAADLLTDASFDALLTNELSFAESPAFFSGLRDGTTGDGLIWLINYEGDT